MQQIAMIWDFRGSDAHKMATHHELHLKDFIKREHPQLSITGVSKRTAQHSLAFMVVNEPEVTALREALKPHRGQVYNADFRERNNFEQ